MRWTRDWRNEIQGKHVVFFSNLRYCFISRTLSAQETIYFTSFLRAYWPLTSFILNYALKHHFAFLYLDHLLSVVYSFYYNNVIYDLVK